VVYFPLVSPFCDIYCSGNWLLSRLQCVHVCSIHFKIHRAIYQLLVKDCSPGPGLLTLIWMCYSYLDLLLHFSYSHPSHTCSHTWTLTTTIPYAYHFPSSILPSRPPESYTWLVSVGLHHGQCNLFPQDRFTRI